MNGEATYLVLRQQWPFLFPPQREPDSYEQRWNRSYDYARERGFASPAKFADVATFRTVAS